MAYTGLELFMENLKLLSYSKEIPLVNNPIFLRKRPQIQLLYEELSFMIHIMFVKKQNDLNETEQVKDLKTRFKDVAHEAHSIVGLFVYSINCRNATRPSVYEFIKNFLKCHKVKRSIDYECSLNLENVMRDVKSVREEFVMIPSHDQPLNTQTAIAGTSCFRIPLGTKKAMEEMVVGLNHDVELIRDKLVEDQKQLDVVSIVGMGGLGKTTLATKVFNDPYVVYHFHIRAWVTVSQTYEKKDLLIQILQSIGIEFNSVSVSHSTLRGMLHKRLMGNRYLVVVDDIWSIEAWNDLKLFLPNNDNGSRILITSRVKEVALHAKSHGFLHHLELLTDDESWELLCKMVFRGNDCPKSLIEPSMKIAKNCHGLPLAVVVIAGVLAREAAQKDSWGRVSQMVSSYVVSDENRHVDILALSYEHLPPYLKDCFLYLGGFPEDHKFQVRKLIWQWIAEGFVQEDGNKTLEEIGEDYIGELVDRNLVVADRKFNGAIKACSVHDLLRELCLERATKGNFCLKISNQMSSYQPIRQCNPRRIFTNTLLDQPIPWVHSLLSSYNYPIMKVNFNMFPLLAVLDLQKCLLLDFPKDIGLLVHLRFLAFWCIKGFPPLICNLWSLQTIIARSKNYVVLPKAISNLVNLRHLWSDFAFYLPLLEQPMRLQTISHVALYGVGERWEKYFPTIKKLTCTTFIQKNDFESLISLETLKWINKDSRKPQFGDRVLTFPASLKKLSLVGCCLPWSDISIIQCLPNLEVLKILERAFLGTRWETGEAQFRQLKLLKLEGLDIRHWEASSINFPCLQQLVVDECKDLEEIPLDIGNISSLEIIDIDDSSSSAVDSLEKILEEQQNFGNYELKINVRKDLGDWDWDWDWD